MKNIVLRVLSYILVAVVAACTTLLLCRVDGTGKLEQLQNLVTDRFIGEAEEKELEDAAAKAMVSALGDRWSHYQTKEEYLQYLEIMSNSYVGVGITIQVREDGTGCDVQQVTAGGPAEEAGVCTGDVITHVDGQSIVGMDTAEIGNLVRGEENTTVELTVLREGNALTLKVTRRRLETEVATAQMLEDKIGLVTIANFDERCAEETIAAIEELCNQGATALVFDVRNNPGGYKREMVEVLDYLLPEGALFRTVDYRGREDVDTSDASCLDIPMAVVVNLHSYSAAEFFAAALDEYDAAVIVGEKTFGKGYFQNTYRLSDGSAVTLSVGKYFTPKGNSLAGVGLTPDVEHIVDEETAALIAAGLVTPEEDPQIIAAVNALKSGKNP